MDKRTIHELTAPFPGEAIRTRPGRHGGSLCYVETTTVIERLNKALHHRWNYRVLEWKLMEEEVLAHVELAVDGIIKHAFGGSSVTRHKQTGKPVSLGDDVKSAASDGLKRAARLLGVALAVYGSKDVEYDPGTKTPTKAPGGSRAAQNREGLGHPTEPGGNGRPRISQRQVRAINALIRKQSLEEAMMLSTIQDHFGVPIDKLTTDQASQVISTLNNGGLESLSAKEGGDER
jgi:hypothetical protein